MTTITARIWFIHAKHRLVATAAILVLAVPAWAETVVYPGGSYPADVQAVQAAVNLGGTVLLKAVNQAGQPTAFDFGPPVDSPGGYILMTSDVEIRGETWKGHMTTIRGGNFPFECFDPVRIAIKRIRFEGPLGAALYVGRSTGVEFSDNVVTGVVGFPWFEGSTKGQAIWMLGGPITGTVTIARNKISDIQAEDGIGLAILNFEADVRIVDNDIRGTNFMGILVFAHAGRVWIEDNVVVPGPERFPGSYSVGQAIQVGPVFPGQYATPTAPAYIRGNRVVTENPIADGIVLFGGDDALNGSAVVNNRVTMQGSFYGGITLYDNVSETLVGLNRISGSAAYALNATAIYTDFPHRRNVFMANDIGSLSELVADVYLGPTSIDSWVIGCVGTVLDEGTNNHVLGCSPVTMTSLARVAAAGENSARAVRLKALMDLEWSLSQAALGSR